jgi:lipopolysaccharide biosynthesis protein
MGLSDNQLPDFHFVAGSMFFARKECLLPLLNTGLTEKEFEAEAGQQDGTMAHAVERAFSSGLLVSGLKLADTSYHPESSRCKVTMNHSFTL